MLICTQLERNRVYLHFAVTPALSVNLLSPRHSPSQAWRPVHLWGICGSESDQLCSPSHPDTAPNSTSWAWSSLTPPSRAPVSFLESTAVFCLDPSAEAPPWCLASAGCLWSRSCAHLRDTVPLGLGEHTVLSPPEVWREAPVRW